VEESDTRPTLKAIILDFSSVNNVDVTSVQNLIDVRNQLDRYVAPDTVNWHFACVNNRWTKRSLVAAGFGYATPPINPEVGAVPWKPIFSVADIGGSDSAATAAQLEERQRHASVSRPGNHDIEARGSSPSSEERNSLEKNIHESKAYDAGRKLAVVHGLNRPLFHIDLTSALQAAIANVEGKQH
jgi:solute carrier family 26 (sodium-independent sulfate anion transporter), member 11